MRVCLISPKWHAMANSYPPLGLGYLAAVLERAGHQVAIFDFGLTPRSSVDEDLAQVASFRPHLVGFTSMTNVYHAAADLARWVKRALGCPIVFGGPHATVYPLRVLAEPFVDYVVCGEGEETLLELVGALEGKGPNIESIHGLCYKANGELRQNPARPLLTDLDALPFPARHLFDMGQYGLYTPDGERMVTILSSRGCPFNCSYCFKGIVGRTYRQRSPENIIAELRCVMAEYNVRDFYFIDDLFTIDSRRLEAFTQRVVEEGLEIRWQCLGRVDRVRPELLRKMYQAGCRQIHYGIESGNQRILDGVGKGITLEQVRQAVTWTDQAGIVAKGYFMLGLPGDTLQTIEQTITFATSLDLEEAMFSITTPFPGTRLWDELVRKHPETEFNQNFSRAYYYTNYEEEVAPFLNVSEVPDATLGHMVRVAHARFQEAKRRRVYRRAFGHPWGDMLWRLSRLPGVRAIGRRLLGLPFFKKFRQLRRGRAKTWA